MGSTRDRQDEAPCGFESLGSFFTLKSEKGKPAYGIDEFVSLADRSILSSSGMTACTLDEGDDKNDKEDDGEQSSFVIDFLTEVLARVYDRVSALTAVVEIYHIDLTYRDLYYTHYSKRFFNAGRFCIRITLFEGELDASEFTKRSEGNISDLAVGSIVLCPINRGVIGRTILRPEFVTDGAEGIDVCLSTFGLTIRGKRVCIRGFTYRQQDGEVMSCAEVSLLNLICFYSNEFTEYAVATPSEILALEEPLASERLTPTRGLDFYDMSRIMSGLRFHPRVYNAEDMRPTSFTNRSEVSESDWMNRILSWYIGSGIPVAVYVSPDTTLRSGHSLLCVGRESWSEERRNDIKASLAGNPGPSDSGLSRAIRLSHQAYEGSAPGASSLEWDVKNGRPVGRKSCVLLDAADFDERYVVVDDAQIPFSINPFDRLGPSGHTVPRAYIVPLHRSMVLDAYEAHQNAMTLLRHEKAGVINWADGYLEDGERVIVKMFMCSARGFKRARIADHPWFAAIYEELVLSRFLWVLELYRVDSYVAIGSDHRAFAEVVLESTSSGVDNPMYKVVFMRYPERMYARKPNGDEEYIRVDAGLSDDKRLIVPYQRNLDHVDVRPPKAQDNERWEVS